MKIMRAVALLSVLWISAAMGEGGVGGGETVAAQGLIRFDPPQALGCVAVRVDVPADQMLTGVRWFNGSATLAFPKILVASGSGLEPPAYSEALEVADNVLGEEGGWSEVLFSVPVASVSGTLFVVLQYPANYEPVAGAGELGVGWTEEAEQFAHYVTGDGETWIKIAGRCRVLVEPVLAARAPGTALKRAPADGDLPVETVRVGLTVAPNPFNPETRIDLYMGAAATGVVRILDVRGCLVAELHRGPVASGKNSFVWSGTDRSGNPVASGVYSVLAETPSDRYVKKVLLVK